MKTLHARIRLGGDLRQVDGECVTLYKPHRARTRQV
jgi:hypothetical protein